MLLALDGGEQGAGGRMSPKHIKDNINPVMQFWQDFFLLYSSFFHFFEIHTPSH